jgi:predicted ATPase
MFKSLEILGLRGFASRQTVNFAIPNGNEGSGLTILVGANNAGKSTAIEALRALNQRAPPSFTQGRRNRLAGDHVELRLTQVDDTSVQLESEQAGTSESKKIPAGSDLGISDLFVLPSRRVFSPQFGKSSANRVDYMQSVGFPPQRTSSLDRFTTRLFEIQKNRARFDAVLAKVLDPVPQWTIDQDDVGNWFLKLTRGDIVHSSEGLGEGLVSLIYIVDALYDSAEGQCIAIDEPELSLHPALQRKLARLLATYAKDRQILLATHSPYFVNLAALAEGAAIARVHLEDGSSRISALSPETAKRLSGLLVDQNNPHVLGLNAQETFFLEDHVILVEGQEDVVFFARVENGLGVTLKGEFFGWGVGGAEKMELIAQILLKLGFKRVAGFLDGNRAELTQALQAKFPTYRFFTLPADDVRTKPARKEYPAVSGLLDDKNANVRAEYLDATKQKFEEANAYLQS